MKLALAAAALALAAPAAAAPRWRAPAPAVDVDDDPRAGESRFWQRALEPDRETYDAMVDRALAALDDAEPSRRQLGEEMLAEAIALEPERPTAHLHLGRALARRGDHAGCASALGAVRRLAPDLRPAVGEWPPSYGLDLELALCLARSDQLDAAAETLSGLVERGDEHAPILERLADVRMAQGRLDDAIVALERAAAAAPDAATPEFALAVAYDRDERPSLARAHLDRALARDPRLLTLGTPARPYAPLADEAYYLGLALERLDDRARALYHFRRYLRLSSGGPWTPRAREHVGALRGATTGEDLAARGPATIALDRSRAALAAADRSIQACVADHPALLLRVSVTKVIGGGLPTSASGPRPGLRAVIVEQDGIPAAEQGAALACVEAAVGQVAWPRPRGDKGSYVTLELSVIAR